MNSGGKRKRRRVRTAFSETQVGVLEEVFLRTHYPSDEAKKALAASLHVPADRITVWFQNRRAKWRRQTEGSLKEANKHGCPVELFTPPAPEFPETTTKMENQDSGQQPEVHFWGHNELPSCMLSYPEAFLPPLPPETPTLSSQEGKASVQNSTYSAASLVPLSKACRFHENP